MASGLSFPALIRTPKCSIATDYDDPALSSKKETGAVITRPMWTYVRRQWRVEWPPLPEKDALALDDFYRNQVYGGSLDFLWILPDTGEEVQVRCTKMTVVELGRMAFDGVFQMAYSAQAQFEEV
jgi:hypothetical protein